MNRLDAATVLVLLVVAFGAAADDIAATDETAIAVLRAVRFAELNRIVLRRDCAANPKLINLPVCQKFEFVPDGVQETSVLPYFKKHVSQQQATETLAFHSSPEGQSLVLALLKVEQMNNPNLLTEEQNRMLNWFNNTDAGKAMGRFANDRSQPLALIDAIATYSFIPLPKQPLPHPRSTPPTRN